MAGYLPSTSPTSLSHTHSCMVIMQLIICLILHFSFKDEGERELMRESLFFVIIDEEDVCCLDLCITYPVHKTVHLTILSSLPTPPPLSLCLSPSFL